MSATSVFPLEIQELRRPENSYRLDVRCFTSVKDIKDQLQREYGYPVSRMQLYYPPSSKCLRNQTTLHDLDIKQAGHVLRLALVFTTNPQFMLEPTKDMCLDELSEEMIREVRLGLRSGHQPAKTDMLDCTGGVYFMKGGSNTPAAVFKPSDEEQGMPNNPKGHAGNGEYGLRAYFKPGEGHIRECAAYILDHGNFCNVPETAVVHVEHDSLNYPRNSKGQMKMYPKLGSLQRFVPAGDTFEDIGHSLVGVLELQKIALLDMRLLNCDRNASNMLAIRKSVMGREGKGSNRGSCGYSGPRKYSRSSSLGTASETYNSGDEMDLDEFLDGPLACSNYSTTSTYNTNYGSNSSKYSDTYMLVPIDHGYCLPSQLRIDEYDWAWFYCPHVEVEVQPEIKEYMNSLDIESLLSDLTAQLPISADCLFLLRVAHTLIKEGINAGLSLKEIACMIARIDEEVPSALENAITNAEDNAQRAIESRAGRRNTTSPAFLKSLEASQLSLLAQNAVYSAQYTLQQQEQTQYQQLYPQQQLGCALSPVSSLHNNNNTTTNTTNIDATNDGDVGLCIDRDSPDSPTLCIPPVLVRQRSVGSPRSNGSNSPPQRIGGHKRIASTPDHYVRDLREREVVSNGATVCGSSKNTGYRGRGNTNKGTSSVVNVNTTNAGSVAKWTHSVARTRSCSLEEEEDEYPHTITTNLNNNTNPTSDNNNTTNTTAYNAYSNNNNTNTNTTTNSTKKSTVVQNTSQNELSSLFRPFPVRATPDRVIRGISSELNLETLVSSFENSPNIYDKGRATSLSSISRSPLPLPVDSMQNRSYRNSGISNTTGGISNTGNSGSGSGVSSTQTNIPSGNILPNLSVNIGYLSSENIQKLQASPSISAAKFPDLYFARSASRHTSNMSGEHTTSQAATNEVSNNNSSTYYTNSASTTNNATYNTNSNLTTKPTRAPPSPSPFPTNNSPNTHNNNNEQYGDYFMKDLSLLSTNDDSTLSLSLPLPLPLVSTNSYTHSACSSPSPHSAFVMVQRGSGSRERLTPRTPTSSGADKLPSSFTNTTITSSNKPTTSITGGVATVSQNKTSHTSSGNISSNSANSSSNSANTSTGIPVPVVRSRAGDPIVALHSFDADYVRVHRPNDYLTHSLSASISGNNIGISGKNSINSGNSSTNKLNASGNVSVVASAGSSVRSTVDSSPAPSVGESQTTSKNNSRTNLASVDNLFSAAAKSAITTTSNTTATTNTCTIPAPTSNTSTFTSTSGIASDSIDQPLRMRECSNTTNTTNASGASATSSMSMLSGLTTIHSDLTSLPTTHHTQQQSQSLHDRTHTISPHSAPIAIRASIGSCSLFASDSDLTITQSVATSQESAMSISPKQSPKQSPKITRAHSDGCGKGFVSQRGGSKCYGNPYNNNNNFNNNNNCGFKEGECGVREGLHHNNHTVPNNNNFLSGQILLRESESSTDAYSPRTINSGSIDQETFENEEQETHEQKYHENEQNDWSDEQLLLLDGPMHIVPLKDMHDQTRLNHGTTSTSTTTTTAAAAAAVRLNQTTSITNNITTTIDNNTIIAINSPLRGDHKHTTSITSNNNNTNNTTNSNTNNNTNTTPTNIATTNTNTNSTSRNSNLTTTTSMQRVASFAAFESPPLYSLPKNDRKGLRLKQEKRKAIALTQEFQDLRLHFCRETISSVLIKAARNKGV